MIGAGASHGGQDGVANLQLCQSPLLTHVGVSVSLKPKFPKFPTIFAIVRMHTFHTLRGRVLYFSSS